MTKNTQNVTVSGTVHGNLQVSQIVAQTIGSAFDRVENADVSTDLKARLKELTEIIQRLVTKLPPDEQEKAVKNLDVLTREATSKKPDRRWYDVSAAGLLEAAKSVAGLATPVISAVKSITSLLP